MNYARLHIAELTSDVAAASGSNPKSCPKFTARLRLFRKFTSGSPTSADLQTVDSQSIEGFNTLATAYSTGDEVLVGQLIDETWVIVDSSAVQTGTRTQVVGFEVPGASGQTDSPQCWYLTISSSNPDGIAGDPPSPAGTTTLYKGHSYDDYSQGDSYHSYLWIFQTCNDDVDMSAYLEGDGGSEILYWVNGLASGNDAWTISSLDRTTCDRDTHITLRSAELVQPTDYTIEDIVELQDADLCNPEDLCSELDAGLNVNGRSITVNVVSRPCGMNRVSLEDDNGQLVVYDTLGSFLYGRELSDAAGRSGVAVLVQDDGSYECYWMITWLDWFDSIQVVSDVQIGSNGINIERKQVDIWRHCNLPDEYILGEVCEEAS